MSGELSGLANASLWPGVSEIEGIVKGLIDRMKVAGYANDQCESLVRRIDGLIAVADICKGLDRFTEILNQIQDIKSRFEAKLKRKSGLPSILRARDRLQVYEDLSCELTDLLETSQLQLVTINRKILIEGRVQSCSTPIIQNFEIIRECDIVFHDTESPTWTPSSQILVRAEGHLTHRPDPIIIQQRLGRLGKLSVTYRSFSAHSDHTTAAERVAEEIRLISRILHPNIAVIAGVTSGYFGLSGFVVAMDGIPIKKLFETSVPGVVLARCIRGLSGALEFLNASQRSIGVDLHGEGITAAPNGHVTVMPSRNPVWSGSSIHRWAADHVTSTALRTYGQAIAYDDNGDHGLAHRITMFLDSLANLGRSPITELRLLEIAKYCGFDPFESDHFWYNSAAPPFTLCAGDLVRVVHENEEEAWEVLEACSDTGAKVSTHTRQGDKYSGTACIEGRCKWRIFPGTNPRYWTWVTDCPHNSIIGPLQSSTYKNRWDDVMGRAIAISEGQNIELDKILAVSSTWFQLYAQRQNSSEFPMPTACLYFHRARLSRSSPRVFWGFISANPDPCALSTEIEDLGWSFWYEVQYRTMGIREDWGQQYDRSLQAALAVMPGAYPGAQFDELSDNEAQ